MLLKEDGTSPNVWPRTLWYLSLGRRISCQTLSKDLNVLSPAAQVEPDLLKVFRILLDTTVTKCAAVFNRTEKYKRHKPMLEIRRKAKYIQLMNKLIIIHNFFKDFTNNTKRKRRLIRRYLFSIDLFWTLFNIEITDETIQQSEKQDFSDTS